MTVHPDCADRVYDNVIRLFQRGINQFLIGPATGIHWALDELEAYENHMFRLIEFYAEMERKKVPFRLSLFEENLLAKTAAYRNVWGCGAGRGRVCIGADGGIYGCAKILGVTDQIDNIRLGDIWSGYSMPSNRWDLLDCTANRRERCQTCDLADDCCGGCPGTNMEENQSYLIPSRLDCAFARVGFRLKQKARELLLEGSCENTCRPEISGGPYREKGNTHE